MSLTAHQRLVFFVAFVILATGVVGVVGRNLDDDESSALTFQSPTASAAATAAPTPAPTSAPTAARTPPPAAAPTPAVVTAPPGGTANMPTPGVYTYKETGDGRFTQSPLRITNTGGSGQKEGQGDVVSDVSWRPDGKYTHRVTFGTPPNSLECNLEPDFLDIKLPLQSGAVWTIQTSCEFSPGVFLRFSGTSSVLGSERVTIGGKQVDTTRIKSDVTFRAEGDGESIEQRIVSDGLFAPGAGLYVRATTEISGNDPFTGEPSNSKTVEELVSLTPQSV